MKKWIHASHYLPDITERYPEGIATRGYDPSLDDIDAHVATLEEGIDNCIDDCEDGEFYRNVSVLKAGQVLYTGNKLDGLYKWASHNNLLDAPLDSYYWNGSDIQFTMRR